MIYTAISIAASVLILLGFWFFSGTGVQENYQFVADNNSNNKNTPIIENKSNEEVKEITETNNSNQIAENTEIQTEKTSDKKKKVQLSENKLNSRKNVEKNQDSEIKELVNAFEIPVFKKIPPSVLVVKIKPDNQLAQAIADAKTLNIPDFKPSVQNIDFMGIIVPTEEELLAIRQSVNKSMRKMILEEETERKLMVWDVLKAGLRGFNKLTGKKLELETQMNEDGKVTALAFNGGNIKFSAKLRNRQMKKVF